MKQTEKCLINITCYMTAAITSIIIFRITSNQNNSTKYCLFSIHASFLISLTWWDLQQQGYLPGVLHTRPAASFRYTSTLLFFLPVRSASTQLLPVQPSILSSDKSSFEKIFLTPPHQDNLPFWVSRPTVRFKTYPNCLHVHIPCERSLS